jgi:hypothetical protein
MFFIWNRATHNGLWHEVVVVVVTTTTTTTMTMMIPVIS